MKKRMIGVTAVLGLLALATAFSPASAAVCPPLGSPSSNMIEFDGNCFAYETSYTPATFNSANGSVLTIVGIIDRFFAPLAGLNPADPTKEYTFVMTGMVSTGTVTTPAGPTTFYVTNYNGGSFAIYEGSPENAPLAAVMGLPANAPGGAVVPANFQDGTAILTGDLCGFSTTISKTGSLAPNGSFVSNYHFTGGTKFGLMGTAEASFNGLWCVTAGGCTPTGYSAHPDGKWDSPPSTPTSKNTWGQLKTLYR